MGDKKIDSIDQTAIIFQGIGISLIVLAFLADYAFASGKGVTEWSQVYPFYAYIGLPGVLMLGVGIGIACWRNRTRKE